MIHKTHSLRNLPSQALQNFTSAGRGLLNVGKNVARFVRSKYGMVGLLALTPNISENMTFPLPSVGNYRTEAKEVFLSEQHPFQRFVTGTPFNDSLLYEKWIPIYWGTDTTYIEKFKKCHEGCSPEENLKNGFKDFYEKGYMDSLQTFCQAEQFPFEVALSILAAESHFYTRATSFQGAGGIAQFMPNTANWMNSQPSTFHLNFRFKVDPKNKIDDRKDPIKSMKAMIKFLKYTTQMAHELFPNELNSTEEIAVACIMYNFGPGNVAKYRNRWKNLNEYAKAIFPISMESAQYLHRLVTCALFLRSQYPEIFHVVPKEIFYITSMPVDGIFQKSKVAFPFSEDIPVRGQEGQSVPTAPSR